MKLSAMRIVVRGVCSAAAFVVPALALAQSANDPSYDGPRQRSDAMRPDGMRPDTMRAGQFREPELPFFRPLNDAEYDEAIEFARQNMPNFSGIWDQLPPERRRRMPARIQFGFRLLLDAKRNDDKRLYEVMAKQMRLRDEFLGILQENRPEDMTRDQRERVSIELRQKTREVVENWLEQRALRLEQMEKSLEAERKKLAEDQKEPGVMIENQFRRLRQESRQFLFMADRIQNAATQPSDQPMQVPAMPGMRED